MRKGGGAGDRRGAHCERERPHQLHRRGAPLCLRLRELSHGVDSASALGERGGINDFRCLVPRSPSRRPGFFFDSASESPHREHVPHCTHSLASVHNYSVRIIHYQLLLVVLL